MISDSLRSSWLASIALCSTLGFIAVGWYEYLIASAAVVFLGWVTLQNYKSRKLFMLGLAASIAAGLICKAFFFEGPGISMNGAVFVVAPAVAFFAFVALRILFLEGTQNT